VPNRVRPLLTIVLIASYLTAPVMALPHAHGGRPGEASPAHDSRPHVHVGCHSEHRHAEHDHHHHDQHAAHHEHVRSPVNDSPADGVTDRNEKGPDAPGQHSTDETDHLPTIRPVGSHDADAVYLSSLVGAGRNHVEASPVFPASVVAAVVETYLAPAGLDARARYWHPPSGARDGTPLYLKLRNLRI
jgi:hypothetical protein